MTNNDLQTLISSWIPTLEFTEENTQFLTITVVPAQLHGLMKQLKTASDTQFDYLFCVTGMDWGKELGVIYHLESTIFRHQLVVKVNTSDRENPTFDSVNDLWFTAEFHELEIFDLFGITFTNHPKLRRLFMPENWEGFPLRKDYVDEDNMVIK